MHKHHQHHHSSAATANANPSGPGQATRAFASAFGAIGDALENGDLAGAQAALTQLDGLLQGSTNRLTSPPVGANTPVDPTGGVIDLTA